MVGKFELGGGKKSWKIRVFVVLGAQLLRKISDKVISVYELERSRDMFKSSQIVSTTVILKEFRNIARYLEEPPLALSLRQGVGVGVSN